MLLWLSLLFKRRRSSLHNVESAGRLTCAFYNLQLFPKLDIGVHTHKEIEQVDYLFELTSTSESTELLVNPNEQIFTEKLLSLLRHRTLSMRPKDIFDMYYLIEKVDLQKLSFCFNTLIYSNKKIQPNNINDIIAILSDVFSSRQFMRRLSTAKANWLMIEPSEVVGKLIDFLKTLAK